MRAAVGRADGCVVVLAGSTGPVSFRRGGRLITATISRALVERTACLGATDNHVFQPLNHLEWILGSTGTPGRSSLRVQCRAEEEEANTAEEEAAKHYRSFTLAEP